MSATVRQLAFDLRVRTALGREAFFVSAANAGAVAEIDRWHRWPDGRLALVGPQGAGKTHLARVWAAQAGARLLDASALDEAVLAGLPADARVVLEGAAHVAGTDGERLLLHLLNLLHDGGTLLITAAAPPARWGVALPDLRSRLDATSVARLGDPDDALLGAVLLKLFADRQIVPPPGLIAFLVGHMERSFAAADAIVAALDAENLARSERIGIRLARQLLDKLGDGSA